MPDMKRCYANDYLLKVPKISKSMNYSRIAFLCGGIAKGVRIFPPYSRICKYEFPKRSLYHYWDNFKQSVGLQGFYQLYYTLRDTTERVARTLVSRSLGLVSWQRDLKWLSICPKYSRKLPKSFFTTEKNSKTKTSPQNEENVFLLIRMTQEDEAAK